MMSHSFKSYNFPQTVLSEYIFQKLQLFPETVLLEYIMSKQLLHIRIFHTSVTSSGQEDTKKMSDKKEKSASSGKRVAKTRARNKAELYTEKERYTKENSKLDKSVAANDVARGRRDGIKEVYENVIKQLPK